jgi:hypothetical protein
MYRIDPQRKDLAREFRKSERGGKTVYLNISVWYNADTDHIHIALPGSKGFHTTVSGAAGSKRAHPNLYAKLARVLNEVGVPGPMPKA